MKHADAINLVTTRAVYLTRQLMALQKSSMRFDCTFIDEESREAYEEFGRERSALELSIIHLGGVTAYSDYIRTLRHLEG